MPQQQHSACRTVFAIELFPALQVSLLQLGNVQSSQEVLMRGSMAFREALMRGLMSFSRERLAQLVKPLLGSSGHNPRSARPESSVWHNQL